MYIRPRPRDRVKAYRKHPDATGYSEDLYAIAGAAKKLQTTLKGASSTAQTTTRLTRSTC